MTNTLTLIREWTDIIFGVIQAAAIIGGGIIAAYEYRRFRKFSPKLEFEVDFNIYPIPNTESSAVVEIILTVNNKGQVRKRFPTILVGVKGLRCEDVQYVGDNGTLLRFGLELVPRHNIVHDPEDPWWVDGGVTQVFRYPVAIEEMPDFLQVNAKIWYYKGRKETKEEESYHQATRIKPTTNVLV